MRKLIVFNMVSLDGFFVDGKGDMSWAHKQDAEWNTFVSGNASGSGVLVFGRITYQLMASYWPTPMALQNSPAVAKGMNEMPKIVFSRTLDCCFVEQHQVAQGRFGDRSSKFEKRVRTRHGDSGKRHHRFPIGPGKLD